MQLIPLNFKNQIYHGETYLFWAKAYDHLDDTLNANGCFTLPCSGIKLHGSYLLYFNPLNQTGAQRIFILQRRHRVWYMDDN